MYKISTSFKGIGLHSAYLDFVLSFKLVAPKNGYALNSLDYAYVNSSVMTVFKSRFYSTLQLVDPVSQPIVWLQKFSALFQVLRSYKVVSLHSLCFSQINLSFVHRIMVS